MKTPVKSPFKRAPISTPQSLEKTSDRFIPLRCDRNLASQFGLVSTPSQYQENSALLYNALIESQLENQKKSKTLVFRYNLEDQENQQKENLHQLCNTYEIPEDYQKRYVDQTPYKILEAPQLQDDFYLNLVEWSNTDLLAVGLSNNVYL